MHLPSQPLTHGVVGAVVSGAVALESVVVAFVDTDGVSIMHGTDGIHKSSFLSAASIPLAIN